MGEQMNYVGHFKFYVVENLSVDALLGIDEIYRHKIRLNTEHGFACNDNVGKFKTNLVYKPYQDIGAVLID